MKKQTKRLVAILLLIALLFTSITIGKVNAADSDNFTVSNPSAEIGETVTVEVKAAKDLSVRTVDVYVLAYDTTKVEIEEVVLGGDWSTGLTVTGNMNSQQNEGRPYYGAVNVAGMGAAFDIAKDQVVLTLKVKLLDGALDTNELPVEIRLQDAANVQTRETVTSTITKEIPPVPATGITLTKNGVDVTSKSEMVKPGDSITLVANVEPTDTTDTVVWTSSNEEVATVVNGVITVKAGGDATITAKAGNAQASYVLNVKVPITSIESKFDGKVVELLKGKTYFDIFEMELNPVDADVKSVTIESDKPEVVEAKGTDNGYTLKALGNDGDTAKITIKATDAFDNVVTKVFDVQVKEIAIDEIEIDEDGATIYVGEELSLGLIYRPENATDVMTDVKWSSSNADIAEVDENTGIVKGIAVGEVEIKAEWNGLEATATVKVAEKPVVEEPEVPTEPTEPEKEDNGTPHTADIAIEIVAVLMIVSLAGIVFIVRKNRK